MKFDSIVIKAGAGCADFSVADAARRSKGFAVGWKETSE